MKLFNTLTRQKEEFVPITPGEVKMYSCGPTVYNYFHVGNARPFIVFDLLRRYFEYRGYKVKFVQNFTDIDDKVINKANEEGVDFNVIADRYIKEYYVDAEGLGIGRATVHPARDRRPWTRSLTLCRSCWTMATPTLRRTAMCTSAPKSDPDYGKLCPQPMEELQAGCTHLGRRAEGRPDGLRGLEGCQARRARVGYAVGAARAVRAGTSSAPRWSTSTSARPSTSTPAALDLIFPHHENEIAQSECANGCTFAHYWLHNGFLTIDNEKMSKSKGNFFMVRDAAKEFGYETIRMFMLSAHYRHPAQLLTGRVARR